MSNIEKPFSVFSIEDMEDTSLFENILFKTASEFSLFVETTANKTNKTCTSIILEYCDAKDMDPDDVAKLISPSLKGKIEREMIDAGLMNDHQTLEEF